MYACVPHVLRLRINLDIINGNYYKFVKMRLEYLVHECHECCQSIRQSKWQNREFKVAISSLENYFRNVFFSYPQLMIFGPLVCL